MTVLIEGGEHLGGDSRWQPAAMVFDFDQDVLAKLIGFQGDVGVRVRELERVLQEVCQRGEQQFAISRMASRESTGGTTKTQPAASAMSWAAVSASLMNKATENVCRWSGAPLRTSASARLIRSPIADRLRFSTAPVAPLTVMLPSSSA